MARFFINQSKPTVQLHNMRLMPLGLTVPYLWD
jgi:hypothetical protein